MRFKRASWLVAALLFIILLPVEKAGTTDRSAGQDARRQELLDAARELMEAARYCALITVDESGWPRAKTMDPFPPDTDMVVWLATNPKTRKVHQIQENSRVALYYFDSGLLGYVTLFGRAHLVDDKDEKKKRWKEGWEALYPDRDTSYLLIAVTPERLEVVSTKRGIFGDPVTWEPPAVEFRPPEGKK